MSEEKRIVDSGPTPLSADLDMVVNPTVERSSAQGAQTVGVLQTREEIEAANAAHRREEERKDNEARRGAR